MSTIAPPFKVTSEHLKTIREYPHVLGLLAGKNLLSWIHSYWILYIWDSMEHRSLQAHRLGYKTTAICVIGSLWWLLWNPDDRIAIIRKKYSDSAEVVSTIAEIIQRPEIQQVFKYAHGYYPRFKTKREGKLIFNFKKTSTPEGSINALGIDTNITGKHYDRIICDDFVTLKDRLSMAERKKTISMLREIITNIIETGKPCGFIGTPWHKQDGWTVCPDPIKYDVYSTGILSEEEIDAKRKCTTPSLFAANYDLKHLSDEGKLFKDPNYGRWSYSIPGTVAHIDAAFDGDHTNGLTFFTRKNDNQIQGFGKTYPGHVKNWVDVIEAEYRHRRAVEIWVEMNADQGYTADLLRGRKLNVMTYSESENKHMKISTYLYDVWEKVIWDERTDLDYMEQIVDYSRGEEPDDCPDSAASLAREKFCERRGDLMDALYGD